jgi:multiple sugar transport system permease protein
MKTDRVRRITVAGGSSTAFLGKSPMGRTSGGRRVLSFGAKKAIAAHLFVLPAIAFFLVWYVYPIGSAIWMSLHKWDIMTPPEWVGLGNFRSLFQDEDFFKSLGLTAYYMVGMPIRVILALFLAVIMNSNLPGKGLFRTIYFLPVVTSTLVTSIVWKWVYDPYFGLIAGITRGLGLGAIPWLTSSTWAMPAVIIYGVWCGLGYVMVLFLAGLQGIPSEYYEAAAIDGANKRQQFAHITLPLLRPVLVFVLITQTIGAAQMFTPAYTMTRGGPIGATRVLGLLIYENGFEYLKMGYASTIALFLFFIMLSVALVQLRFFGRRRD